MPQAPLPNRLPCAQVLGFVLLLSASLLQDFTGVQQMEQTCCLSVHCCSWMGERAGAGPPVSSVPLVGQVGDGWGCSSSSRCPSPSLLNAGFHIPGSLGCVPRATGRGGCARSAGFPPQRGSLQIINENVLWKQQLSHSGDDAVYSAAGSTCSWSSSDLTSWYFVWGDEMQCVADVFVNQFTSNMDICSCLLPSCWELNSCHYLPRKTVIYPSAELHNANATFLFSQGKAQNGF